MKNLFALVAVLAAFSSLSTPAFANEASGVEAVSPEAAPVPDWNRNHPDNRGQFVCTARNIAGRTFTAYGNGRMPPNWVAQRALEQCRRSGFLLGRTCRFIGCHSIGGWDNGHGGRH